jgi:agmatine/peptidylarginine deiminase
MKLTSALVVAAFCFSTAMNAQVSLDKAKKAAETTTKDASKSAANAFDTSAISSQVMDYLSPKLKLTEAQKPAVTSLVNDLLKQKKVVLPSAVTDKNGYDAKMTTIRNTFPEKMKKLVSADQLKTLTTLIPKSSSSSNILSKMLF